MRKAFVSTAVIILLCLGVAAQAVVIQTVAIGDAGNAADTTGYGSVDYNYSIGKYEVTAGQYTEFLNAKAAVDPYGLWKQEQYSLCRIQRYSNPDGRFTYGVDADYANRPVVWLTYWSASRFANWLNNGQGDADTEYGAYTLAGHTIAQGDGHTIQRNSGAYWAITSEDEWYKAAYYKNGVYSRYAFGTNSPPAAGFIANYNNAVGNTWDVTMHSVLEQNGTRDMMGNVSEYNEAIISGQYGFDRGVRGGAFSNDSSFLQASSRYSAWPSSYSTGVGFRLAYFENGYQPAPEPSSLLALAGGLVSFIGLRRRRG